MKGFSSNKEKEALDNENFGEETSFNKYLQIVPMSLKPGQESGEKILIGILRFIRFNEGKGKCIVDGTEYSVGNGDAIVVPAGAKSNVINTDAKMDLKMYTFYTSPHYEESFINSKIDIAEKHHMEFAGKTTELISANYR